MDNKKISNLLRALADLIENTEVSETQKEIKVKKVKNPIDFTGQTVKTIDQITNEAKAMQASMNL